MVQTYYAFKTDNPIRCCSQCPCFDQDYECCNYDASMDRYVRYDFDKHAFPRPDWCPLMTLGEACEEMRRSDEMYIDCMQASEVANKYGCMLHAKGVLDGLVAGEIIMLCQYVYDRMHGKEPTFTDGRTIDAKSLFGHDIDRIIFDELGGDDA